MTVQSPGCFVDLSRKDWSPGKQISRETLDAPGWVVYSSLIHQSIATHVLNGHVSLPKNCLRYPMEGHRMLLTVLHRWFLLFLLMFNISRGFIYLSISLVIDCV